MVSRLLSCCAILLIILVTSTRALAQDYDIQRYDLNLQLDTKASQAQLQLKLSLTNITTQGRSGQQVVLKVNKRATVTAVQVEGTNAQFQQKNDERTPELANVNIDLPKPLAPGASTTIALNYTLEWKESTAIAAIVPGNTLLLPESFWLPVVHLPFAPYGPDIAPITINATVNDNEAIQSSGTRRIAGTSTMFEQSLPVQPLLLTGNFDDAVEVKTATASFEFFYPKGIGSNARKQAEAIAKEGNQILEFYRQFLGITPPTQIRIVSSARINSYVTGNLLVLGEDLFRREVLDLETVEFLARALLRHKIGSELAPRTRGWTVVQDALPIYFASFYFEKQYGKDAAQEFFARRVRAYAPVAAAHNDGPLLFVSPLDNQYAAAMFNKAPLMLRIIEQQLGREKFIALVKEQISTAKKQLRFEDLRRSIVAMDKGMGSFFDQWFDKIVEPDFIVGVPQAAEGGWKCALRNLGTGEVLVPVVAVTEKGDRLTEMANIGSQSLGEIFFKTTDKISSVEVDPDKLYPQISFDNDARPAITSPYTLFKEANASFLQRDFASAENKLRTALQREPQNTIVHTLLARTLLAANKPTEAKKEVEIIWKQALLPTYTITWTNSVWGEMLLASNPREAIDYLRRAVISSKDIVPIRQKLIEVERSNNRLPPVDESVRAFISQLDRAIREATAKTLEPLVVRANLSKFLRGIVVGKPESWSTEILRADMITANEVAIDVAITAVTGDKQEQRGTAVYILQRNAAGWVLSNIELFNLQ